MDESKLHILAISAVIRNEEGKFLVVKRGDHETAFPGKWAFPGGKLERGETILDCVRREVMEEAGIEIEDGIKYLDDYTFVRPDNLNVIGLRFLAKAKSFDVRLSGDFDGFRWVSGKELGQMDCIDDMEKISRMFGKR
jgi:mutator protein MutT